MMHRHWLVAAVAAGLLVPGSLTARAQVAQMPRPVPVEPAEAPVPPPPRIITPVAHVETIGSGPIHVVLIPSLGCDWSVWSGFMARNSKRFTMHAVTLPPEQADAIAIEYLQRLFGRSPPAGAEAKAAPAPPARV